MSNDLRFRIVTGTSFDIRFGQVPSPIKYWDGTAWVTGILKSWNGSAWVTAALQYWNGSAWISL